MRNIKYLISSGAATLALMLGLAVPAAAQSVTCTTGNQNGGNDCGQSTTTNTDNTNNSVTLGNCSVNGDIDQVVRNRADNDADGGDGDDGGDGGNGTLGTGGAGGAGGTGGSTGSQSNSQSGSNTLTFTCTTNNVTNVTQAAPQVLAAQVSAPKGGVGAGAGGAVASTFETLGLAGSVATTAVGAFLRKRFE